MIHVEKFAGLRPAVADRALPNGYATVAHNARLRDGSLGPLPGAQLLRMDIAPIRTIYRPGSMGDGPSETITLPYHASITEGPMPGSTAEWSHVIVWPHTDEAEPHFREVNGATTYPLRMPAPTARLRLAPLAPGEGYADPVATEPDQRSYTYTWVDRWGIEGQPAPPTVPFLTFDGLQWQLTGFSEPPAHAVSVRIYRTGSILEDGKSGQTPTQSAFHLVEEVDLDGPIAEYDDTRRARDLEGDTLLTIDNQWLPVRPLGVAITERGNYVAWAGHSLYISEPHEPWNWPERLRLEFPDQITGMAVTGDTVYLGTTGTPYRVELRAAKGLEDTVDTATVVERYLERYPCLQRWTMVATSFGAMYASARGLVMLRGRGNAALVSKPRIDEEEWMAIAPNLAAWHNGRYYGTRAPAGQGLVFDVQEDSEGGLELGDIVTCDLPAAVVHAATDGHLYFADGVGLYRWGTGGARAPYRWASKVYEYPSPTSLAAACLIGDRGPDVHMRLYGDGDLLYDGTVKVGSPQRLPVKGRFRSFVVEVAGTTRLDEIRVGPTVYDTAAKRART